MAMMRFGDELRRCAPYCCRLSLLQRSPDQAYDIANVGLAVEQPQFNYTVTTTDCGDLNSGNSNCGHEFGTRLSDPEKARLEYLKTL